MFNWLQIKGEKKVEENNENQVENNENQELNFNPKKKSSKQLIILIACILGVLAVTVGALTIVNNGGKAAEVNLRELKGTPQEIVHSAILNTKDKFKSEMALIEEKNGGKSLLNILESEAVDTHFNVTIKNISGMEDDSIINAVIKDLAFQGNFLYTKDGKYWDTGLKALQGDLELIGATLYKSDQEIGIDIPKILGNPYALKLDSILEDFKNSPLYAVTEGQGIDDLEIAEVEEAFTAMGDYFTGLLNIKDNKEYIEKYNKLIEETIKGLDIEKLDEKADGYNVYDVTVTGEQLSKLGKEQMAIIMELDFMQEFFDFVAKESGVTKEEFMEQMLAVDTYEGLELKFELHLDEHFIRSGVCTVMDTEYEEEVLKINFNFGTKDYLSSELNIELTPAYDVDFQGGIKVSNNLEENSDIIESGINVNISSDGETGYIDFNTSYDTKAKSDNYTLNLKGEMPYVGSIDITGVGNKVVSRKEVSTTFEDITCNIESYYGDAIETKFGVAYGAKVVKAEDVKFTSKKEVKYVLEMSMAELMAVAQTIQNNLQSLGSSWLQ